MLPVTQPLIPPVSQTRLPPRFPGAKQTSHRVHCSRLLHRLPGVQQTGTRPEGLPNCFQKQVTVAGAVLPEIPSNEKHRKDIVNAPNGNPRKNTEDAPIYSLLQ